LNEDPGQLFMEKRFPEAELAFREHLKEHGESAGVLLNLGLCLKELGRNAEAFESVQKASELEPGRADIWNELGLLWDDEGRLTKSEACYRRAVELDPTLARAWNNLGVTAFIRQNFPEAKQYFSKALELDPGMESARLNLIDTDEEL